ncbi:MAG: hypothetical protein JJ899_06930 [Alphaproteobacteria bacterium]|nr:hypothetical protein [Alphaproteobacteria bacterium]
MEERKIPRLARLPWVLATLLGASLFSTVALRADSFPKYIFYCSGIIETKLGAGSSASETRSATTVVLEVEAERLVMIGHDATAVLRVLRTEERQGGTVFHFGGINDAIVYKGSLSLPNLELKVRGTQERLRIDIRMDCGSNSPLRLF